VPGSVQPAVPPVTAGVDSGRTWVIAGLNAGQTYSVSFFRWNSAFTHWSRSSVTFVVGTSSHDAVGATATPVVVYGSRPTVTATVSRVVSGSTSSTPLAGVPVELWSRTAPSATWVRIATGTTAATGKASFLRPTILATTAYQVRLAPQGYLYPAVVSSAAVTTALRPVLTASFAATTRVLAKSVKVRTKTYVYALVSPHRVTTVQLQRYVGGVWKAVSTVRTASTGLAAFSYRPTARGKQALRVVVVAGPSWTSAVSSGLRLVVS